MREYVAFGYLLRSIRQRMLVLDGNGVSFFFLFKKYFFKISSTLNMNSSTVILFCQCRGRARFRRTGFMRRSTAMVGVLRRAELWSAQSYQ